jgi:hypothetical protein
VLCVGFGQDAEQTLDGLTIQDQSRESKESLHVRAFVMSIGSQHLHAVQVDEPVRFFGAIDYGVRLVGFEAEDA